MREFNVNGACNPDRHYMVNLDSRLASASNNQIFLDFLAMIRYAYLNRDEYKTFQSVILAGVHDVRNLKTKLRPDSEHKHNGPWNIAANFDVDTNFNAEDIKGMLLDYESDHHTKMDMNHIAEEIYDYTSGYPVLVSGICKYMDERYGWDEEGLLKAIKAVTNENSPLFDSLMNKIEDNDGVYNCLYEVMVKGTKIPFNRDNESMRLAYMYGFIKETEQGVQMSNRIFETRFYDYILTSAESKQSRI